jgi:group I intron endonuclease
MGIIYLASNLITGKNYVGQTTKTLEQRKAKHLQNSETDLNNRFYQAIRKHGIHSFEWEVLEEVEDKDLDEREIYWIREFNSLYEGYNMTIGGGTVTGYKHSEETKKKIGKSRSGVSMKDIYIEKYGEEKGLEVYEQYVKKLQKTNGKGRTRLEMFIEKHGEVEGRNKYDTFIKRIKETRKEKLSEEHKKKIGESGKGRIMPESHREKLRSRIYTDEHKRKISEARKEYWRKIKAQKKTPEK